MTIWHAMHHLAGWPARVRERTNALEGLRLEAMWAEVDAGRHKLNRARFDDIKRHNDAAEKFNARKFWWMRKIKLMSE